MWGKRTAALILCLMMALVALPNLALAAEGDVEIEYSSAGSSFQVVGDQVIIQGNVLNNSENIVLIDDITAETSSSYPITVNARAFTPIEGTAIAIDGSREFSVVLQVSGSGVGTFPVNIKVLTEDGSSAEQTFLITKAAAAETPDPEESPDPVDNTTAIMLSSADITGAIVPAPRGDAGDTVHIRLPLLNRSRSKVSKILVTPQMSATLDAFPFVIEAVDYTCKAPDLRAGELAEVEYTFKLSSKVTSGVKEVKFNVVYFNFAKDAYETATVSVFVTVVKGASGTLTDEDGMAITSTPKVIIESYSITPAKQEDQESGRLFAGEQFDMSFTIRNTSSKEAVQNIQITISNEGGVILPANNGSNSLYIDRISAGDSVEKTLKMQSSPDAEDKAHSLSVKFGYESSETLKTYEATETITLPVSQRMRVRIDDPVIYGDAMIEQSTPLNFSLYNMGKASLYNCMVDVEGEGLRMEEAYFGGNITAGSQMRADFNIIPSTAGQIEGKVIITYEDVYGQETRVEKPFTLNVQEAFMPGPDEGEGVFKPGFEEPVKPAMPMWVWIVGGVVVVGGLFVLLKSLRKKRRKRELEDV